MGSAADLNLLVDTRATGHLLCAPQGMNHFLAAAKAAAAEVIILDPLYSTHDQDENDTRSMAALCQSLLRLRDASGRRSDRGASCPQVDRPLRNRQRLPRLQRAACGGRQLLAAHRPSPQLPTVELRFQFRYAAAQPPRLLQLDPQTLWFSSAGPPPATPAPRRKVEKADVTQALTGIGEQVRYTQLRDQIMDLTECSKRTAQLAITEACRQGVHRPGRRPIPPAAVASCHRHKPTSGGSNSASPSMRVLAALWRETAARRDRTLCAAPVHSPPIPRARVKRAFP